jgi:hypothetical protein
MVTNSGDPGNIGLAMLVLDLQLTTTHSPPIFHIDFRQEICLNNPKIDRKLFLFTTISAAQNQLILTFLFS